MTSVDRVAILSHLRNQQTSEQTRTRMYGNTPYTAMMHIAADRAYTFQLLADAVDAGLLEQLDAAARCATHNVLRDDYGMCGQCETSVVEAASVLSSTPLTVAFSAPGAEVLARAHDTAIAAMRVAVAPRRDDGAWEDPAVRAAVRETIAAGAAEPESVDELLTLDGADGGAL